MRCAGVLFWPSAAERRWAGRPDRVNFLALLVPVELSGVPAFLGFLFAFLFNCLLYKLGLSVRAAAPHPLPTCYRRSSPERSHCAPLALHITLGGLPCLCLQQPSSSALPLEDSPHVHAEAPHCLCRCSRHAALRAGATLNALLAPLSLQAREPTRSCSPVGVQRAPWLILDVETPCLSLWRFPVLPGLSPGSVACRSA